MPGTDIAYGVKSGDARAMQCPVLSWRIVLRDIRCCANVEAHPSLLEAMRRQAVYLAGHIFAETTASLVGKAKISTFGG
eukprot:941276-Rhodomonas_salina.2